ncbi:Uncharacterised protein [Rikenella microfusus]|uniref:Uncharacterized protein n=1 Tax=Rikenella microfusus TaxID=28139 RepID=A0A379MST8_9BACT|nr:Uncharacterised protein [Rikenella microfusus]
MNSLQNYYIWHDFTHTGANAAAGRKAQQPQDRGNGLFFGQNIFFYGQL